ncbi:MAG: serine/threonine protein phosphatase [Massilia sp.]|nr:serine/threonine protein phosphatase [Massilia sp.]
MSKTWFDKLRLGSCWTALLLCAACSSIPPNTGVAAGAGLYSAYTVEGAGGAAIARVITRAPACPLIQVDGKSETMHVRAPAETIPTRAGGAQEDAKPASFPVLACDFDLPAGTAQARIGQHKLPLPAKEVRRIVVIGDTGCRLKKSDDQYQACSDDADWPFAQVVRSAAATKPDLVIHVGDYHYRESPCPSNQPGCAQSPWGYGFDTWSADFFEPARPLLAIAPWIFVRGNHETCARGGQGWFRFLDSGVWSQARSCNSAESDTAADYTAPYAVPVGGGTQFIVFDSSKSSGKVYNPTDPAFLAYSDQLKKVDGLAVQLPQSFFLSHHPVLGLAPGKQGGPKPSVLGLPSVMRSLHPDRLFGPGITLAMHGHVHLFEALSFASDHPATLVLGNSGSATEGAMPDQLDNRTLPFADTLIEEYSTRSDYGFAVLERAGSGWDITEHDKSGLAVIRCKLERRFLKCAAM